MNNPNILFLDNRFEKEIFINAYKDNPPTITQYNVTKREVMSQNLTRFKDFTDTLTEIGKPARKTIILSFDGWDYDPRALTEIPEVTAYIKRVVDEYEQIWYFLIPELNPHIFVGMVSRTMFSSPLFPKTPTAIPGLPNERRFVQLDIPMAEKLLNDMKKAVTEYGMSIGDERGAKAVAREWQRLMNL